jgi:hypothetical protein
MANDGFPDGALYPFGIRSENLSHIFSALHILRMEAPRNHRRLSIQASG